MGPHSTERTQITGRGGALNSPRTGDSSRAQSRTQVLCQAGRSGVGLLKMRGMRKLFVRNGAGDSNGCLYEIFMNS